MVVCAVTSTVAEVTPSLTVQRKVAVISVSLLWPVEVKRLDGELGELAVISAEPEIRAQE